MNCYYCQTTLRLVQCLVCKDFFCNTKHLVHHLVVKRHSHVSVGTNIMECKICFSKNIFNIGYLEDKRIICRECNKDNQIWKPIIQERAIVEWLMGTDDKTIILKNNEKVKEEIIQEEIVILPHTKQVYKNYKEYKKIFLTLIKHERDEEEKLKQSIKQENVVVNWLNSRTNLSCSFVVNGIEMDYRMSLGDEMEIRHSTGKKGLAFVVEIKGIEVTIELKEYDDGIDIHRGSFTIKHIWRDISYERMIKAVKKIKSGCSRMIFEALIGNKISVEGKEYIKDILKPPELPNLNKSQKNALIAALTLDLTLIQGPPGTGKTITSAAIAYNICKLYRGKVLIVSPSNTAVDHLTSKLSKTGIKVLRVVGRSRESISSNVDELSLHFMVRQKFPNMENANEVTKKKILKFELRKINEADVITCTCVTAGKNLLQNLDFPYVIVDEAGTCTEPLNLIPLINGCIKLVLVGDQKQLGPTLINQLALRKAGYSISLFERLIKRKWIPHMLNTQYRMHPLLSEFPANTFYDGLIKNGVTEEDRYSMVGLPMPTFFYACLSSEELGPTGTSYLNLGEAVLCEDIVARLEANGINPDKIGVITPYECQRSHLLHRFGSTIEVANVDAFQGREKDYIIVSFVRSSYNQSLGFVDDPRRLNVTLTRARYGLILIGNPFTLRRSKLMENLLYFYDKKGLIYKGSLDNLKQISLDEDNIEDTIGVFDFKAIAQALYKD